MGFLAIWGIVRLEKELAKNYFGQKLPNIKMAKNYLTYSESVSEHF